MSYSQTFRELIREQKTLQIIDVSKIKMDYVLESNEWLDSFKGNCTCSGIDCPETCYCLEGHTPRLQLRAKLIQYRNYPHQYDLLFYGDVSN